MRVKQRRAFVFIVVLTVVFLSGPPVFAQTNLFFYDSFRRLAVVIATNKTAAAFYNYDAGQFR